MRRIILLRFYLFWRFCPAGASAPLPLFSVPLVHIIYYANVVVVTSNWTFGKYLGYNTPPEKLRLRCSTRPPASSRCRPVPSAQQHYDVPAKERASLPHLGEGEAWKSPSRGRLAWHPAWRGISNNCKSRPAREHCNQRIGCCSPIK